MTERIPDIRFYDFEFNLLHVENHFISSNWNVKYNDIGSFEAHFDLQSDTLTEILGKEYVIAVQGNQAAIIIGKKLGVDLTLYGRTCNWMLKKRVTDKFSQTAGSVKTIVCDRVAGNVKIDGQYIAAFYDVSNFVSKSGEADSKEITAERTDKCETFKFVQETLSQEHLGHEVRYSVLDKEWQFRVLQGYQNNLVISTANRNAYDVTMENDSIDTCTEGWYKRKMENMGDWDPSTNKVTKDEVTTNATFTNNTPSNYGRYWKIAADYTGTRVGITGFKKGDYLICRETTGKLKISDNADSFWVKIQKESPENKILRWETVLTGESESEAMAALYKAKSTSNVQGKTAKVYFGSDYALGDVVTVQYQAGAYKQSAKKRIVGVNLWYESGNVGEEPVFEDYDEE